MRLRITAFIVLVVLLIGGAVAIERNFATKISLQASTDEILDVSTATVGSKKFVVELAKSSAEKTLGLSGRTSLAKSAGMLFIFSPAEQQSFWMKDMKFALDIIWATNNKIAGIERNAPIPLPGTSPGDLTLYNSPAAVDFVLEINAGQAAGLNVGDSFTVETAKGV